MKSLLICFCFMIYLEQATTDHYFHGGRTSNVHLKLVTQETPELRTNLHVLEKKVVGCPDGCFQAGSECFMKLPDCTSRWDEALQKCAETGHPLAEPEDFQAVADYLNNNNLFQHCMVKQESLYWIGAHTGPNNNTVQWVSGDVVGANAPWVEQENYEKCSKKPMCMALGNEAACKRENVCIGCIDCVETKSDFGLNTLCECEPIFVSECSPECIHGECVGPNQCQCEPGWMGPLCDKRCPDGCFQSGSECFIKLPNCTSSWDEALQKCAENGHSLAEPEDFQAVADYLNNNNMFQHCMVRQESVFWIGAHTGPNNDSVQWVSGDVIGTNAPWVNTQNYEECSKQPMCMVLANEAACKRENVCIGCVECVDVNQRNIALNTLCECEPIFV